MNPKPKDLSGYVVIARALANHEIWLCEKKCRPAAMLDIILLTNTEDRTIFVNGRSVLIKRGQLGWSARSLAQRWQWGLEKTTSYLRWLDSKGFISYHGDHTISVITVLNYEAYQSILPHSQSNTESNTDPLTDPLTDLVTDPGTDPSTDPLTDPSTESNTDPTLRKKKEGKSPPKDASHFGAEVPSEAEVEQVARNYPGDLARGIPPTIPDAWWTGWLSRALNRWTPMLSVRWRQMMILDFRSSWLAGRPDTRHAPAPGAPVVMDENLTGKQLLWSLQAKQRALRKKLEDHPHAPGTHLENETDQDGEQDYYDLQKELEAVENRIIGLRSELPE